VQYRRIPMPIRTSRFSATALPAVLLVALALSGCAESTPSGTAPEASEVSTPSSRPSVANTTVDIADADKVTYLFIEDSGGLTSWQDARRSVPFVSLIGGQLIVQDGQANARPGQLARFASRAISPAGLTELRSRLKTDGFLDPMDFGQPGITDQSTVRLVVKADDGLAIVHDAYALGREDSGLTEAQVANRNKLKAIVELLRSSTPVTASNLGPAEPFVPTQYELFALPITPDNLNPALVKDWPLATTLKEGCNIADDIASVETLFASDPAGTQYRIDDAYFEVAPRIVLWSGKACPPPIREPLKANNGDTTETTSAETTSAVS
jgi:hypothetical protein